MNAIVVWLMRSHRAFGGVRLQRRRFPQLRCIAADDKYHRDSAPYTSMQCGLAIGNDYARFKLGGIQECSADLFAQQVRFQRRPIQDLLCPAGADWCGAVKLERSPEVRNDQVSTEIAVFWRFDCG